MPSVRDYEGAVHGASKVLEFKYRFDSLIQDFEDKTKIPAEIDLVVCWDLPELNVRRGQIIPTYGEWRDSRSVYAGSYKWVDDNETTQFPVLALKTIVAELLARAEVNQGKPGIGAAMLTQISAVDKDSLV
ncbi:hypothetical protein JJQ59_00060 [Cupriavidus necator]|uniref:hypothetical protein n=1 Tax=Cupriavidus necator TaxID=106590 RepID=UPI0011BD63AF|nr:hypothetical protein [Cupriavidus necator]QQX84424.1 hypothetical protein JJQ59_00060 [Cupriavidus necator]